MSQKLRQQKQMTVYLDSEMVVELKQVAWEDRQTVAYLIRESIRVMLETRKTVVQNNDELE